MAVPITGINGNLKIGGGPTAVALINSWDLTPNKKMNNSVVFGETWEDNVPSVGNWAVKASGFWNGADTNGQTALQNAFLNNTVIAIELDIDGVHKWTGNCYLKTMPQKNVVDGLNTQDYEFSGTGALAYA